jgi:hypothetical protein
VTNFTVIAKGDNAFEDIIVGTTKKNTNSIMQVALTTCSCSTYKRQAN